MSILTEFAGAFLWGAAITVWISWLALLLGAAGGAVVGLARLSRVRPVRGAAIAYIEVFRSIPIYVLLYFVFYGMPFVSGINLSPFAAATVSLSLIASSFMAEVVRAGIQSVAHGQWEAAQSSGMRFVQTMRHVVGPQAIRVMLPPSIGVYISTLKESSLASVIGYVELTQTGLLIREATGNSVIVLGTVAMLYFVINYSISLGGGYLERRFRIA